ncbi:unnamed protein product [Brugia timori]|uniref:Secreted protein n=1 Tax=Brugia timori TaxID=42155 RepID=A0A0R3QBK7_9BILA|nr:unnamed protein product [Brugia timori]
MKEMKFLEYTRGKALLNISHLMMTISMTILRATPITVCTRGREAEQEEYCKQSPIAVNDFCRAFVQDEQNTATQQESCT